MSLDNYFVEAIEDAKNLPVSNLGEMARILIDITADVSGGGETRSGGLGRFMSVYSRFYGIGNPEAKVYSSLGNTPALPKLENQTLCRWVDVIARLQTDKKFEVLLMFAKTRCYEAGPDTDSSEDRMYLTPFGRKAYEYLKASAEEIQKLPEGPVRTALIEFLQNPVFILAEGELDYRELSP